MKQKKLLLTAFALLIVLQSNAQRWRFGLKAAPAIAWFKTDTKGLEADGAKLTFSWGFMGEYFFAENYALSSGVEVASYGGKLATNTPLSLETHDLRLSYIEVPISVKMRTNEIGYMRYFGQFGFSPGFNISAKDDFKGVYNNTVIVEKQDEDVKSDIVPVNVALLIALGAEYGLSGNTALVFSVSFHNGFVDVSDFNIRNPDNLTETKSTVVKANAVRLNVGVLF